MTTGVATTTGLGLKANEGWPGIVSRFQLVLLAGRRSKQLLKGAQPRIPADPLKKRNTSIALEELKQGLVIFKAQNRNDSQMSPTAIDGVGNSTRIEAATDFGLRNVE
jgi:DNA-directed RNA polymerase omega subunit